MRFSSRQIGWLLGFVLGIWLRAITAWIVHMQLKRIYVHWGELHRGVCLSHHLQQIVHRRDQIYRVLRLIGVYNDNKTDNKR